MTKKIEIFKKKGLIKKLTSVKALIKEINEQLEAGCGWTDVQTPLVVAINQLKLIKRQLALYHLRVCLTEKFKKRQNRVDSMETIREFVKTYNFLQ